MQIELRKGGITKMIVDGSHFEAENRMRISRQIRVNPGNAYARMYHHIGKAISAGASGDRLGKPSFIRNDPASGGYYKVRCSRNHDQLHRS
jgi:hypothetical protein